MLKNIPPIITPELLKILDEMGHGDSIVIGDGNFPAAANAKRLVRLDGNTVPEILDAVLKLIPLDPYGDAPVKLMALSGPDAGGPDPEIWSKYREIIEKYEPGSKIEQVERFDFYEKARNAFAVVSSGETAVYANIILRKGVVKP